MAASRPHCGDRGSAQPLAVEQRPAPARQARMRGEDVREAERLLPGQLASIDMLEPQSEPCSVFRYGELMFEETGRAVPYLIVPDTPDGRDPKAVVS